MKKSVIARFTAEVSVEGFEQIYLNRIEFESEYQKQMFTFLDAKPSAFTFVLYSMRYHNKSKKAASSCGLTSSLLCEFSSVTIHNLWIIFYIDIAFYNTIMCCEHWTKETTKTDVMFIHSITWWVSQCTLCLKHFEITIIMLLIKNWDWQMLKLRVFRSSRDTDLISFKFLIKTTNDHYQWKNNHWWKMFNVHDHLQEMNISED